MSDSTPSPSPLSEASPSSLDELFSRDPLDLSRTDRATIVAEFRRMAAQWRTAEASGAKRAPATKAAPKGSIDVNTGDLGL